MSTAIEPLMQRIQEIQNGDGPVRPGQPLRLSAAAVAGDVIHQGDIRLQVVNAVPAGYTKAEYNPDNQENLRKLAKGTTRGSRHVIADLSKVDLYLPTGWNDVGEYLATAGPVLVVKEDVDIVHADGDGHGTVTIEAGLTVQCNFALTLDLATRQARRTQD